MNTESLTIKRAESLESIDIKQLVKLYLVCFADPPYEESFQEDEVRRFFASYISRGIVLLCLYQGDTIAFSASLPLRDEADLDSYVSQRKQIGSNPWYFAELGVDKSKRRMGLGRLMTSEMLDAIPSETTLVRTTEKNRPAILLYEQAGFVLQADLHQEVEQLRIDGVMEKDRRVFLLRRRE